ncbi:MAG: protein-L-isoaspartate(D-aspartate) O-methyltransferase [Gammaproteobacteria bacterium]
MTSARTRERLVKRLQENGISNPAVLERVRSVPRHLFVDEALSSRAYEDSALPIGQGQTISQPYIVARMTQELLERDGELIKPEKVLEVGTGCGYQTAVLAPLVKQLFSIERVAPLLKDTRERLRSLGLRNIRLRHDDGFRGWPGQAPFDGIIVTAAPAAIPEVLLEQLAPEGRLIVPVGTSGGTQTLVRITRTANGFVRDNLCEVSFVPMLEGKN